MLLKFSTESPLTYLYYNTIIYFALTIKYSKKNGPAFLRGRRVRLFHGKKLTILEKEILN